MYFWKEMWRWKRNRWRVWWMSFYILVDGVCDEFGRFSWLGGEIVRRNMVSLFLGLALIPWPGKKRSFLSFCRSMNFYRHEMTRVSKNISKVWNFFGHIFGAIRRTPTPNRPKTDLRVISKNPILQFKVLLSTYGGRKYAPQRQDVFYLVKLLDKKLLQKFLVPRNTPRTPHLKSKNRDFWPSDQTSTPKIQG